MIIEVRSYRTMPGRRDEFVEIFENRVVPVLHSLGIDVFGPMMDLENPNKFVWLRGYASAAERDRLSAAFYGGEPWTGELEGVLMPMLASYDVTLCETSAGAVWFAPR